MTDLIFLVLFCLIMTYAGISDLVSMTIPNFVSLCLVAMFMVFALVQKPELTTVLMHLTCALFMLVLCFGLFSSGVIGGGDAKLAAATALWLGFATLMDYLILAGLLGGVLTAVLLGFRRLPLPPALVQVGWIKRLHHPQTGVPYGIALGAAAVAVCPRLPLWTEGGRWAWPAIGA